MTDDRTPLQRLDDAVHTFAAEIGNTGTVGAWVVAYELTRIVDEPGALPLQHSAGYAIGPAAGAAAAHGLAAGVAELARQHVVDAMRSAEEPE
jgi:hypothetical protein